MDANDCMRKSAAVAKRAHPTTQANRVLVQKKSRTLRRQGTRAFSAQRSSHMRVDDAQLSVRRGQGVLQRCKQLQQSGHASAWFRVACVCFQATACEWIRDAITLGQ
eukprot:1532728-Prymnesium_polylepis.3